MWVFIGSPVPAGAAAAAAGRYPCPAVPGTIEGCRCGAGAVLLCGQAGQARARRTGDDTHEITGNFVEEVTLPDTVRVLDSAAFYNCRRLRRVTLGPGVEGFGSDLFTNCRQLQTFRLRAAADAPTGLKKLLGAVSADITVDWTVRSCFTPSIRSFWTRTRPRISSTTALRARATGCGSASRPAARWITPRLMRRLRRPASARVRTRSAG